MNNKATRQFMYVFSSQLHYGGGSQVKQKGQWGDSAVHNVNIVLLMC